jgi:cell division septal protein FtsQ
VKLILGVAVLTLIAFLSPMISEQISRLVFVEIRYIHIEGIEGDDQIDAINQQLTVLNPEAASIAEIKLGLEELEWVHHVNVRKRWPDKLSVFVAAQAPLARWNETSFLNADGEVFHSSFIDSSGLPSLMGPLGTERLVMWQYQKLNGVVGTAGENVELLRLSDRGSWSFNLGGVFVRLGKEDILERMRRFLRVFKEVGFSEKLIDIVEIDTRYPNGIAVRWKDNQCQSDCVADNYNLKRDITL